MRKSDYIIISTGKFTEESHFSSRIESLPMCSITPILLIISGFVGFEEKLVEDYSPVAKIFSGVDFNIGKFSLEEIKEVLLKPLSNEKKQWTEGAIAAVQNIRAAILTWCNASHLLAI